MEKHQSEGRAARSPAPFGLAAASAEEIYCAHAPLLRRVAIRRFGVPANDADTLVHDVFIGYLARPENVRSDLRAYLIGAICNACRNYWRAKRSEGRVFDYAAVAQEPLTSVDDLTDGLAHNQLAAEVLAALAPRCRELLRRHYMEDEKTAC